MSHHQLPPGSKTARKNETHADSEQSGVVHNVLGADVVADSDSILHQPELETITKGMAQLSTSSLSKAPSKSRQAVPPFKLTGWFETPPQLLFSTTEAKTLAQRALQSHGLPRGTSRSVTKIPATSDVLLSNFAKRFDLFSTNDSGEIFSVMERGIMRHSGQRPKKSLHHLSTWAVMATLDKQLMFKAYCDIADVQVDLCKAFPSALLVERFPSWNDQQDDILLIRGILDEGLSDTSRPESPPFLPWLAKISAQFPFQGGKLDPSGDIDTFWSDTGLKVPAYLRDPVLALSSLYNRLKTPLPDQNLSQPWIATTGRLSPSIKLNKDGKRVPVVACVACRCITFAEDLREAPGKNKCCSTCYNCLIDVCYACTEPTHKMCLTAAPCGHNYCNECLLHLFKSGTTSLSEFPPKCCDQPLSVHTKNYQKLLSGDITKRYLQLLKARDEAQNVHCATVSCERSIIKAYAISDDWGFCEQCLQMTCIRCFQAEQDHKVDTTDNSRSCPKTADDMLFELAESNSWRKCPNCNVVVSRSEGCNDMLCRCGQRFCYTCGKKNVKKMDCGCPMTFEGGFPPEYHPNPPGHRLIRELEINQIRVVRNRLVNLGHRLGLQCYFARTGNTEATENLDAVHTQLRGEGVVLRNNAALRAWLQSTLTTFELSVVTPAENNRGRIALVAIPRAVVLRFNSAISLGRLLPEWTDQQVATLCPHQHLYTSQQPDKMKCALCREGSGPKTICFDCNTVMCGTCFGRRAAAARVRITLTPDSEVPVSMTSK